MLKKIEFPVDERDQKVDTVTQVQSVLLRMLKILDAICEKHNIGYWLEYGTLLGAIRHEGFIPWDYEADIGMIRPDYESFLHVIQEELPEDMFFQNRYTDAEYKYHWIIEGKIRDRYSKYDHDAEKCSWHTGIQIDIFVYDLDKVRPNSISNQFERYYSEGKIFLKFKEIEHTILKRFEGIQLPVPIGYEDYLKRAYGDYMTLPPINKQVFPKVSVFTPCNHPESKEWKKQ